MDLTALLAAAGRGERDALDRLIPEVYAELRRLARRELGHGRRLGLETTSLVHEAYLRLIDQRASTYRDRGHFCAIAAQVIRRVLIDHVRAEQAQKRGGGAITVALSDSLAAPDAAVDLLRLDDALDRLALLDAGQARIVELRYFAGLTIEETADALDISPATVKRDWSMARAYLIRLLESGK